MNETDANYDPGEVAKFDKLASRWWDPDGDFKPLHQLNPLRLSVIQRSVPLTGKRVLDVGCGGGILAESLARAGARVTGIDISVAALDVARAHQQSAALGIDYRAIAAEALAAEEPGHYDVVTCLELLEHVPDPGSLVAACAQLVRPRGQVFFSTINRNPKAYALAVVAAEYVLRLLPRGTHDYERFIKPSELASLCRNGGLSVERIVGLRYDPISAGHQLSDDVDVNYMLQATRRGPAG